MSTIYLLGPITAEQMEAVYDYANNVAYDDFYNPYPLPFVDDDSDELDGDHTICEVRNDGVVVVDVDGYGGCESIARSAEVPGDKYAIQLDPVSSKAKKRALKFLDSIGVKYSEAFVSVTGAELSCS